MSFNCLFVGGYFKIQILVVKNNFMILSCLVYVGCDIAVERKHCWWAGSELLVRTGIIHKISQGS